MRNYIQHEKTGLDSTPWIEPVEWIDINTVANNEILLLVTNDTGVGLLVKVGAGAGTFSIDWGDGTIDNNLVGDNVTVFHHVHTTGGILCGEGYEVWKVRIYNATGNITGFKVSTCAAIGNVSSSPVLNVNIGTIHITDCSYMFYTIGGIMSPSLRKFAIASFSECTSASYMFAYCYRLYTVSLPESWGLVANVSFMFQNNFSLPTVKIPTTWGLVTNCKSMFDDCENLETLILPDSWGLVTDVSYMLEFCYFLKSVKLPTSWGQITNCSYFLYADSILQNVTLPDTWGLVTDVSFMFSYCAKLQSINLPGSWGQITNVSNMFSFCRTLHKVTLPDSWGLVTNVTSLFQSAYFVTPNMPASWGNITTINNMFAGIRTLRAIALPDSWGLINSIFQVFNSVPSVVKAILPTYRAEYATVFNYVFYLCISLSKIENIEFLGSLLAQCDFTSFIYDCPGITQEISITSLLKRIDITGTVTNKLKISSIRLANQNSLFAGGSPQINVVYTSLQKSALETLFGDIPVGLTSKTVAITGAIGCDAPVSKAAIGTTINSTTVTMSDTSLLSAGMEVYGTGISTAKAVTFTDAGDLVNRTAHGLSNGMKISFSSITSTTGIVVNTPYYVINAAANTFQVSLTLGGSAIALTTNGSGNLIAIPTIVTINAGVSIVIDVPCSATASVTLTAGVLKRSIALLKGWTITN